MARSGPLTAGAQVQPPPGFFQRGPQRMWQDVPSCSSFAFSYSPSGGPVGAAPSALACVGYWYQPDTAQAILLPAALPAMHVQLQVYVPAATC